MCKRLPWRLNGSVQYPVLRMLQSASFVAGTVEKPLFYKGNLHPSANLTLSNQAGTRKVPSTIQTLEVQTIRTGRCNFSRWQDPINCAAIVYNRLIVIQNFDQAFPDTVGLPPRPKSGQAQE